MHRLVTRCRTQSKILFSLSFIENQLINTGNQIITAINLKHPNMTKCIQLLENNEANTQNDNNNSFLRGRDIFRIIQLILENQLDFNNRLNGSRSVLEQWQKTRANKNEEFSIKFRESGNECLKEGQLNEALHFYNEALLLGGFIARGSWLM